MRRFWRQAVAVLALAAAVGLWCLSPALAKKPSGGGGGGGGGTPTTKPYRLVKLPGGGSGYGLSMNQLDPLSGTVEIVGRGGDGLAHYWRVADSGTDPVLIDFSLALPPNSDRSNANDVNDSGVIVGYTLLSEDAGSLRAVFWPDAVSDPVELPVPDGFDGAAYAEAVNSSGIVVGYLHHSSGAVELAAWQILEDAFGPYGSSPTVFPWTGWVGFDVNDAGWVAATSTLDGTQKAQRFQLVWNGTHFTIAAGGGNVFGPDVVESNTLAINQRGDVAGEQVNDEIISNVGITSNVFAMSVSGTLLNLPTSIGKNSRVVGVSSVSGINDATAAHAVQVLAEVRTRDKSGYVNAPRWCVFEEHGTATILEDATALPAGLAYLDNLSALNDASWICGAAYDTYGPRVPVVLIRHP